MTQSTEQGTIWLTQDAYDKLAAELDHLKGPGRQEVVARISAARDEGDLKENGGYHAAREEQGKLEGRIRQLEDMLRRAEVGETPPNDGVVEPAWSSPTSSWAMTTTRSRRSCSAPARSSRTVSPSTRRSPRWAPPSTATPGRDRQLRGAQRQQLEVVIVDAVPTPAELRRVSGGSDRRIGGSGSADRRRVSSAGRRNPRRTTKFRRPRLAFRRPASTRATGREQPPVIATRDKQRRLGRHS